ncbi:hypothetical protein RSAG8_12737, partial [Rhizoctonia solani AG-8 WAC10335]
MASPKLIVVDADNGDTMLLEYDDEKSGKGYWLIDGGPLTSRPRMKGWNTGKPASSSIYSGTEALRKCSDSEDSDEATDSNAIQVCTPGANTYQAYYQFLQQTLLRYCRSDKHNKDAPIDLLKGIIVTHPYSDHTDGIIQLIEADYIPRPAPQTKYKLEFSGPVIVNDDFMPPASKEKVRSAILWDLLTRKGFNSKKVAEPGKVAKDDLIPSQMTNICPDSIIWKLSRGASDRNASDTVPQIEARRRELAYVLDHSYVNQDSIHTTWDDGTYPRIVATGDSIGQNILDSVSGLKASNNPSLGVFKVPHHGSQRNSQPDDTYQADSLDSEKKQHCFLAYACWYLYQNYLAPPDPPREPRKDIPIGEMIPEERELQEEWSRVEEEKAKFSKEKKLIQQIRDAIVEDFQADWIQKQTAKQSRDQDAFIQAMNLLARLFWDYLVEFNFKYGKWELNTQRDLWRFTVILARQHLSYLGTCYIGNKSEIEECRAKNYVGEITGDAPLDLNEFLKSEQALRALEWYYPSDGPSGIKLPTPIRDLHDALYIDPISTVTFRQGVQAFYRRVRQVKQCNRATNYVISANGAHGHSDPSTVAGIIAAAIERKEECRLFVTTGAALRLDHIIAITKRLLVRPLNKKYFEGPISEREKLPANYLETDLLEGPFGQNIPSEQEWEKWIRVYYLRDDYCAEISTELFDGRRCGIVQFGDNVVARDSPPIPGHTFVARPDPVASVAAPSSAPHNLPISESFKSWWKKKSTDPSLTVNLGAVVNVVLGDLHGEEVFNEIRSLESGFILADIEKFRVDMVNSPVVSGSEPISITFSLILGPDLTVPDFGLGTVSIDSVLATISVEPPSLKLDLTTKGPHNISMNFTFTSASSLAGYLQAIGYRGDPKELDVASLAASIVGPDALWSFFSDLPTMFHSIIFQSLRPSSIDLLRTKIELSSSGPEIQVANIGIQLPEDRSMEIGPVKECQLDSIVLVIKPKGYNAFDMVLKFVVEITLDGKPFKLAFSAGRNRLEPIVLDFIAGSKTSPSHILQFLGIHNLPTAVELPPVEDNQTPETQQKLDADVKIGFTLSQPYAGSHGQLDLTCVYFSIGEASQSRKQGEECLSPWRRLLPEAILPKPSADKSTDKLSHWSLNVVILNPESSFSVGLQLDFGLKIKDNRSKLRFQVSRLPAKDLEGIYTTSLSFQVDSASGREPPTIQDILQDVTGTPSTSVMDAFPVLSPILEKTNVTHGLLAVDSQKVSGFSINAQIRIPEWELVLEPLIDIDAADLTLDYNGTSWSARLSAEIVWANELRCAAEVVLPSMDMAGAISLRNLPDEFTFGQFIKSIIPQANLASVPIIGGDTLDCLRLDKVSLETVCAAEGHSIQIASVWGFHADADVGIFGIRVPLSIDINRRNLKSQGITIIGESPRPVAVLGITLYGANDHTRGPKFEFSTGLEKKCSIATGVSLFGTELGSASLEYKSEDHKFLGAVDLPNDFKLRDDEKKVKIELKETGSNRKLRITQFPALFSNLVDAERIVERVKELKFERCDILQDALKAFVTTRLHAKFSIPETQDGLSPEGGHQGVFVLNLKVNAKLDILINNNVGVEMELEPVDLSIDTPKSLDAFSIKLLEKMDELVPRILEQLTPDDVTRLDKALAMIVARRNAGSQPKLKSPFNELDYSASVANLEDYPVLLMGSATWWPMRYKDSREALAVLGFDVNLNLRRHIVVEPVRLGKIGGIRIVSDSQNPGVEVYDAEEKTLTTIDSAWLPVISHEALVFPEDPDVQIGRRNARSQPQLQPPFNDMSYSVSVSNLEDYPVLLMGSATWWPVRYKDPRKALAVLGFDANLKLRRHIVIEPVRPGKIGALRTAPDPQCRRVEVYDTEGKQLTTIDFAWFPKISQVTPVPLKNTDLHVARRSAGSQPKLKSPFNDLDYSASVVNLEDYPVLLMGSATWWPVRFKDSREALAMLGFDANLLERHIVIGPVQPGKIGALRIVRESQNPVLEVYDTEEKKLTTIDFAWFPVISQETPVPPEDTGLHVARRNAGSQPRLRSPFDGLSYLASVVNLENYPVLLVGSATWWPVRYMDSREALAVLGYDADLRLRRHIVVEPVRLGKIGGIRIVSDSQNPSVEVYDTEGRRLITIDSASFSVISGPV